MPNEQLTYRGVLGLEGLVSFQVSLRETVLSVSADSDRTSLAGDLVAQAMWEIESFVSAHPRFAETWSPYDVPRDAPALIRQMAKAGGLVRVGPMAGKSGTIAEYVAKGLAERSTEVVVQCGTDAYLVGKEDRTVALWAGRSSLSGRVGMRVRGGLLPLAVCTSSGSAGRDGTADAAAVLARDGAVAGALARAIANRVADASDIQRAIDAARSVRGVLGLVVAVGDHLGAWGNVHLTALDEDARTGKGI